MKGEAEVVEEEQQQQRSSGGSVGGFTCNVLVPLVLRPPDS